MAKIDPLERLADLVLLLLDASNPRAVAFQAETILQHTVDLPMVTEVQQRGRPRAVAIGLYAMISSVDAFALTEPDADGTRSALLTLLDDLETNVTRVADAVGDAYLQHLPRFRA